MAGINHIRRWVMGQMTKKADDGIMITLPDSKKSRSKRQHYDG
jgi:hypothetical protein